MKDKTFLILLIVSILFSCAPFSKKVVIDNQIVLKKESVSKLNGTYEVGSIKAIRKFENLQPRLIENDSLNSFSLFENLKETNQELREDIKNNIKNYQVKIYIENDNTISFSLLKNDIKIDSIKMNYKIRKDGFIYLKNKNFRTEWVPVLCGNFEVDRTKIGINNDDNLIISNSYFIYGAILVIIGDTRKSNFSSEYKRKI
ncbi:hypothetical protein [Flavobacterium weaverense]|uniref:Uncharacterized protein n=1 Tax=Flavobacterium weaverense TaxID=271156 RepID=A0A3L9ZRR6_9FLAO|nr:hypothetical protein [Flavobacterium weaverense]RMA73115.1 hypothetical protein BC961_2721 [Flavobacterium weaverense]